MFVSRQISVKPLQLNMALKFLIGRSLYIRLIFFLEGESLSNKYILGENKKQSTYPCSELCINKTQLAQ